MKILDRLSNLIRSNVNAAIDGLSDPGKEIDLLIEQMEDEAKKARIAVRDQIVQEKRCQKRVDEIYRGVQKWQEHAERAVHAGDDELAREALRRKDEVEKQLEEAEKVLAEQSHQVARMTAQLKQNDEKIADIKRRKGMLKERARQSRKAIAREGEGDAFSRFDELVSQIEMNEHQAAAMAELAAEPMQQDRDVQTAERFDRLLAGAKSEKDRELDDRLAELKARLDKKDAGA